MNTSPCTQDELDGFEHISDFLYPEGKLDEQALALFIEGYHKPPASKYYYHSSNSPQTVQKQVPAMGLLLRLIDTSTPRWLETFELWYSTHRMENEAYMGAWFSFLDEDHKEMTKTAMLKMLAGAPPIEIRVALMMDGMEHYRDLPVQTFIGKSLLRVKSASFVKALKPRTAQMPMVLRMAKELTITAPEFSELAQAITMGVFVQRMSDKPAPRTPQSEYSACEAFSLVIEHGTVADPELFVKSAKSRFKGSTLLPDMMKFVTWSLESDPSKNWMTRSPSEQEKEFAGRLMAKLMDDILLQSGTVATYDGALTQVHATVASDEQMNTNMRTWFTKRLKESKSENMAVPTFVYLLDKVFPSEEHSQLWAELCRIKGNSTLTSLLEKYLKDGGGYYDPARYYALMCKELGTAAVVSAIHNQAPNVFDAAKVMAGANVSDRDNKDAQDKTRNEKYLQGVMAFFDRSKNLVTVDVRQNESFKQLVAAMSMAYLLHASRTPYSKHEDRNGLFVNLLAEPLPLLRSMYPEHTNVLNALRKDIIARNSNYHGALYSVLSRALYTEDVANIDTVVGLTESMGMSPFSYFQACVMQKEVHFEVSGDVFETGMF